MYVFGTAGLAYFATRTDVEGDGCDCGETNFDDTALSLAAGGGFRVALSSGRRPVSLTVGTSYVHNPQVDYVLPGDIEFTSQGYVVSPVRSDVDFMTFELGIRFAF
jgi:opacity protein-like surface antigen